MSTRDNGMAEYALVIDEDTMYQFAEKTCKDFNKDDRGDDMCEVYCMNKETGCEFTKSFCSPYLADKFVRKCKWSKKIVVIGQNY